MLHIAWVQLRSPCAKADLHPSIFLLARFFDVDGAWCFQPGPTAPHVYSWTYVVVAHCPHELRFRAAQCLRSKVRRERLESVTATTWSAPFGFLIGCLEISIRTALLRSVSSARKISHDCTCSMHCDVLDKLES